MKFCRFLFTALVVYCIAACNNAPQPAATPVAPAIAAPDTSWALLPFHKADSTNPVWKPGMPGTRSFICPIRRREVYWESKNVLNPAVVVQGEFLVMLYRAQDSTGTSRIGALMGNRGLSFDVWRKAPVLYPANDAQKKYEWKGGCEDPRVVEDSTGTYYMTYTAFDGTLARLMVASSRNLVQWTKHGPAFGQAYNGKYLDKWSKSGSIVSSYQKDGKIVATRIHGKYWMYWGDVNIWAATSTDLIHWEPVEMDSTEKPGIPLRHNAVEMPRLRIVLGPRSGKFDSDIVEPGPPAMITPRGILLIYNGRNTRSIGDTSLAEGTYATGQVLMDAANPTHVLQRLDHYFMKPTQPYEITGEVNQVCFAEGLVWYGGRWLLYYGTADSKIAVAVKN